MVININDVESYGSNWRLNRDFMDKDSDANNEGVTQGVELLAALEPRSLQVDAPSAASTEAGHMATLVVDEFYNATGKAPHLDARIRLVVKP